MAKDPAFLFYPGDYLRDTQILSEASQVAYDRIMCEHMRNICISQQQLKFLTKKLTEDELSEIMSVLSPVDGGYQIEWVALSISKRKDYSESRRKNRTSSKKDMSNISDTYVQHMENENEIVNEDEKETKKEIAVSKKTDSIHNKCIEVYSDFIKNRTGVGPKIGGSGGKAMKTIIEYLSAQIRSSHPEYDTERINLETVSAWNWVLSKFSKWSPFHQEQIKLEQINSNLINIIANIKNPTNARKSAHEQSTDNLRELREKEEQRLTELLVANGHSKKQGSEIISSD